MAEEQKDERPENLGGDRHFGGTELTNLLEAGLRSLESQVDELNRINVFPVPDGDTGTNMFHTLRSTLARISTAERRSLAGAAAAIEAGALYAARGNSGVILAAFLRGFCASLRRAGAVNARSVAAAFHTGAEAARSAVDKPVEGTVLTLMAEAAPVGLEAAEKSDQLPIVLDEVVAAAERSLEETPRLLPALQKAGVFDAGAAGFLAILQGMSSYLNGGTRRSTSASSFEAGSKAIDSLKPGEDEETGRYGYCTELMIEGPNLDRAQLRDELALLGDSLLVIGTNSLLRVHIHSVDPGRVLSACVKHGSLHGVSIRNMDEQAEHGEERAAGEMAEEVAVAVAIVDGEGFAEIFRSLGAQVLEATEGERPAMLLARARKLSTARIVVLPNQATRFLELVQPGALDEGRVRVAETRNMVEGIAALFEWEPDRDIEETLDRMKRAASEVTTAAIDRRGSELTALVENEQVGTSRSFGPLARSIAEAYTGSAELCTLYYGDSSDRNTNDALMRELRAVFPGSRIEVHYGGQSEPLFLISLE